MLFYFSDSSSSAEPVSIKSEQEGNPISPQLSSSAEENEQGQYWPHLMIFFVLSYFYSTLSYFCNLVTVLPTWTCLLYGYILLATNQVHQTSIVCRSTFFAISQVKSLTSIKPRFARRYYPQIPQLSSVSSLRTHHFLVPRYSSDTISPLEFIRCIFNDISHNESLHAEHN